MNAPARRGARVLRAHNDTAPDSSAEAASRRGPPGDPVPPPASNAHEGEATLPALRAARLVAFDAVRARATLRVGDREVEAALDAALSPVVVATAVARGERAIVVETPGGRAASPQSDDGPSAAPEWLVLGTLRTAPTPGVDTGEEFVIRAKRVLVAAEHEFAVVSGVASFVVRARGFVETLAEDITTRAASVHKIVGRIVRLN